MVMETYFTYETEETDWLKAADPVLGKAVDAIGHIDRPVIPDLFTALISSIVSQQISNAAYATVWGRMCSRIDPMTPETIDAASIEEVQACGISYRKAGYIKDIAGLVLDGSLNLAELSALPDDEVCKRLCALRGIGVWTAEMLMIFSMQRKNIISWDDLALHRGLRMLYRHRSITPKLFAKYKRRYAPYATVACLYLWAIAAGACPELKDPAQRVKKNTWSK